ncbi:hypothetical protein AB0G15_24285 [Streptosporangium sp. NPDC023825]|uniref:hypothetical protein n=1 Tax=Streptosporangium sp. NPDC023825 TaxID=3154909 RepID=UPI00342B64F0
MIDIKELVGRYVAVWNEPDAELRRKAVAELWTEDGVQILQPPQEIRETAAALGLTPVLEARGHEALEVRVARSYEEFIAPGEFFFRMRDNVDRLADVVKFNWEMVPTGGGEPAGVGLEILVLGEDGRIRTDYQFIEG